MKKMTKATPRTLRPLTLQRPNRSQRTLLRAPSRSPPIKPLLPTLPTCRHLPSKQQPHIPSARRRGRDPHEPLHPCLGSARQTAGPSVHAVRGGGEKEVDRAHGRG